MAEPSDQDDGPDGRAPDKLLTIGIYGETVAGYRYLVLSEKSPTAAERRRFAALADIEHDQKQRLQKVLAERFPHADGLLSPADKALVVSGPRLLDVYRCIPFEEMTNMVLETARKTTAFYAGHGPLVSDGTVRALFHGLAEESAEQCRRLEELAAEVGAGAVGG